jgi:DNA-binding transcriptional ArsR family regulator
MPRLASAARVQQAAALFNALGDPTRLSLVQRLSTLGPESISGLSENAQVSRQAITKHLYVLSEAGLVLSFREGRERIWKLKPKRLNDARAALNHIDALWDEALDRLKAHVEAANSLGS